MPLVDGTLPFAVSGKHGAGRVLIKPASPGTGLIAGGGVRLVMELAGVRNALTKCLGSTNPHNSVKATLVALQGLEVPEAVAERRGKTVDEMRG